MTKTTVIRLAQSCAYSAHAPEWEQFVELVMPIVALAARRICSIWSEPSQNAVSEIVQEVFVKLCEDERKVLRGFEDRGHDSFVKFLRTITASVATDYFRHQRAEKRGGRVATVSLEPELWSEGTVEGQGAASIEWPTLIAQLDNLLRLHGQTVSRRDRTLFWLYYRQGMTAEAISRIPSIRLSAKGVESALLRLTRLLRETVVHGKPARDTRPLKLSRPLAEKGFHRVIAIDSVKRR